MTYERCPARLRADALGRYCSRATASSTRSRVSSRTFGSLLSTRETVFIDTPAAAATSSIRVRMTLGYSPGCCGRARAGRHDGDAACCMGRLPPCTITSRGGDRSEEHTSELQSLMRISYAV